MEVADDMHDALYGAQNRRIAQLQFVALRHALAEILHRRYAVATVAVTVADDCRRGAVYIGYRCVPAAQRLLVFRMIGYRIHEHGIVCQRLSAGVAFDFGFRFRRQMTFGDFGNRVMSEPSPSETLADGA